MSITGALTRYHLRFLIKNPYIIIWPLMVALSLYFMANLENLQLSGLDWIRWSLSSGMAPAYLLMPLIVRSTPLGVVSCNGEGFFMRRTRFTGKDTACGIIVLTSALTLFTGLTVAVIARANHFVFGTGALMVSLLVGTFLTMILLINVVLVINLLVKSILFTYLLVIAAAVLFYFYPELSPWHVMYRPLDVFSYGEPMLILNRLFCVISSIILARIYVLIVENTVYGQGKSSDKKREIIIAGQKTSMSYFPWQGILRAEILIFGFRKLALAVLFTLICVLAARYSLKLAIAGMGGVWLALMPILCPYENSDRLLLSRLKKSWLFIGSRLIWWGLFGCLIWGIFFSLVPTTDSAKVLASLLEVGGLVWLSVIFLYPIWARFLGIILWTAIVFIPEGLTPAGQQPFWMLVGIILMILSIFFYRRMPA